MINPHQGTVLLSPIEHKTEANIGSVILQISNQYENNLRERNIQLGRVESEGHGLIVGDIVACHHFTFYGDVSGNGGFVWQEHFEQDGVKYFRVPISNIYFKYNNKTVEELPGFMVCHDVKELKSLHMDADTGEFSWNKKFDKVGKWGEKNVVVKSFAFYLITLDRVDYFKVREDEVVLIDGEPTKGNMVVEYIEEPPHPFLDLSLVKKPNNVRCRVFKSAYNGISEGDELLIWRNNGVEWDGKWVIDEDIIIGIYETA